MDKVLINGAGIALFAFALLAPSIQNKAHSQALNMDGQSGILLQPEANVVTGASS